jgi:hypothetical protein
MSRVMAEPADPATEHYRHLMRQNHDFIVRMSAALKSGAESAAGMTATVRTTRDTRRNSEASQVAA